MSKRTTLVLGSWGAALVASVAIVKLTAIGPVILTISARHGWGVHTGDALVLIPVIAAAVVTVAAAKRH